jgi:hypothetical protein
MELKVNHPDDTTEEMNGGCSSSGHPGAPYCSLLSDYLLQWW